MRRRGHDRTRNPLGEGAVIDDHPPFTLGAGPKVNGLILFERDANENSLRSFPRSAVPDV